MIDIHAKDQPGPSLDHLRAAMADAVEEELMADAPVIPLDTADTEAPVPVEFIDVEQPVRFSQSKLWEWQREYFNTAGVSAWSDGVVPHYITSSSYICKAYAGVVFGRLRDLANEGVSGPVHLVELGTGSGQFAFHFLQHLTELFGGSVLEGKIAWKYVMTDFTESNIRFWESHNSLQPYVDAGLLDWAHFDCTTTEQLKLQLSGTVLKPSKKQQPIIAIANYLFDTIPQDLFWVEDGKVEACKVALAVPAGMETMPPAELIAQVALRYEHEPADQNYYQDAQWNELLKAYATELNQTALLFPHEGLACIQRLAAIAGQQLTVLSGDKGYVLNTELRHRPLPGITRHGSFSMSVNYHAIKRWFEANAGTALHVTDAHNSINVCCFVLNNTELPETTLAFQQLVSSFGPDQQFVLKKAIERNYLALQPQEILSYVRMSGYDPKAFRRGIPSLTAQVANMTPELKQQLDAVVVRMWQNYYPLGEQPDLAFLTGVLLYELDLFGRALELFQQSLHLYGEDAGTYCNVAMCFLQLGNREAMTQALDAGLALDPHHAASLELRQRVPSGPRLAAKSFA